MNKKSDPDNLIQRVSHPFEPVVFPDSRVLILGTMPSVQSRAYHFYYGHPRNRFWPLLACIFGSETPQTIAEKKKLLHRHAIALWDVIQSCQIRKSADQSIRTPVMNPVEHLIDQYPIQVVLANGQAAARLYNRYIIKKTGMPCIALPSTSPANARWTLAELVEAWRVVLL
jgi:double-stranded uracil-DNA glycosylase